MTGGILIFIWMVLIIVLECIQLWLIWKTEEEHAIFKKKVMKILREHDISLYPPKLKTRDKVIPYVRPIRKNK